MMNPQELKISQSVLQNLRSEKYKGKNELFLLPFDLAQVPGYLDVVKKVLDLQTVAQNLEKGIYNYSSFWEDVRLVFENAVAYHAKRPETKWIAKFAKDMLRNVKKERDKAEKENPAAEKKPNLKLKLPTKQNRPTSAASTAKTLPVKAKPKQAKHEQPTKPKLKLKLSMKLSVDTAGPEKETVTAPLSSQSRGKELPKVVQAAKTAAAAPKPKKPKKPKTAKATPATKKAKFSSTPGIPDSAPTTTKSKKLKKGAVEMTPARRAQCHKVIYGLKRRQPKNIAWFLQPITDKAILPDYKAKIKHPMDISKIISKLDRNGYSSVDDVALDFRRIFANCLIFNTSLKDGFRPIAVGVLETTEQMLAAFLGAPEVNAGQPLPYSNLLFCWRLCIQVLDTLFNLVNPNDGQPTALYFLHPVSFYCGGAFPPDYLQKVRKPMDFGTITANLLEGRYETVDVFAEHCRLVVQNCRTYYAERPDGALYLEQAGRLYDCMTLQLDQLSRYMKSSKGASDRLRAQKVLTTKLPSPPASLLLDVIQELRGLKYTDKATKISEPALGPFEKPVNVSIFSDYLSVVAEPMDVQQIERKCKANLYVVPEDFEYDFNLIFKNCETYNSQRNGQHVVAMAKFGSRKFRAIFYNKLKGWEGSNQSGATSGTGVNSPPAKRAKIDSAGTPSKSTISPKKAVPRISITAAQLSGATSAVRGKSPKSLPSQLKKQKSDAPVPLHIAIARVKEDFPLRRAVKNLQSWEAECARYFKELLRHPWLSTARPKFIFHVPVPHLFPALRDAYAAKIQRPMDLTTVECQLLVGSKYFSAEDFLQDVALVFTNAIHFNKDGRDIGDPLSCAYYDASVHLLRYSRWLSMDTLGDHADKSSEYTDDIGADGLPPLSWKLTMGNVAAARKEMEKLVFNEFIDKSLEGDRWTWHEAECEKLLKSLRHQSDLKYMKFFLDANYPLDYTAYISKPMDWEKIYRGLRKRQYDKFGDVVGDLRLIFTNALKYNSRHKGTDSVSGEAYVAAELMSKKLETAISKMLLTASDRLERERIDHANAEREIEAAEKAEEEAIRAAWKKDSEAPDGSSTSIPGRPDPALRVRLTNRRALQRSEPTDFEVPFFDEDQESGRHERSYFELIKLQKSMFAKQQLERTRLRETSSKIGAMIYSNLLQQQLASKWKADEEKKTASVKAPPVDASGETGGTKSETVVVSSVLSKLEVTGRKTVSMKLAAPPTKKVRKRTKTNAFDE